ncbi:hypothetical protein [Fimbriimonas ginsengisoli]|uniref:Uncharacterized protein n=1 Tax=Fimbriimonas ginsengisoli Gsoil 348 TaxID=661478 RepID=A0A068NLJ3_FIMGI|nr:hypothetical protein [Fimbriimonas ginsengisoli]AIE83610.1 hypothetical protein OP10G_0242 [Fimbriimonas ginsengisoli Gsoil 348]
MFFLGALGAAPTDILKSSLAAHSALGRFRAHVTLTATFEGHVHNTDYVLAVDGKAVLLRVRQPKSLGVDRSDRTFFFGPSRMVAYDAYANERLTRPLSPTAPRVARMLTALGQMDDMMRNLLEPKDLATFYDGLKNVRGWSLRKESRRTVLSRQAKIAGGYARSVLVFDPGIPLLRRMDVSSPGSAVHWTFDYSRGGPVSYSPPRSAKSVDTFTVAPEPPRYANAAAKRTTEAMMRAYRTLSRGIVEVEGDDGRVRVSLSGRKVREDQERLSYAYDGKVLTISDPRTNSFYRGAVGRVAVPEVVAAIRGRVDPLVRQIFQHRVPFSDVVGPLASIAIAGQVQSQGVSCDILRITDPRSRVSIFVRRDNHLAASVSTDVLDRNRRTLVTTTRNFGYSRLGVSPPASLFVLSPARGQRLKPLPKLVTPKIKVG